MPCAVKSNSETFSLIAARYTERSPSPEYRKVWAANTDHKLIRSAGRCASPWTNYLCRHQSICRLSLKTELQENFPAFISHLRRCGCICGHGVGGGGGWRNTQNCRKKSLWWRSLPIANYSCDLSSFNIISQRTTLLSSPQCIKGIEMKGQHFFGWGLYWLHPPPSTVNLHKATQKKKI